MTVFKNAIVDGNLVDIKTENGKITQIGKIVNNSDAGIDLKGNKVYAGLVDIHTHGCIGYDTMDEKYLNEMSNYLAKCGTTAWLPTTMTMDFDTIKNVVNIDIPKTNGAAILGFHMEGPYISPKFKGAQNEKYIKSPDIHKFNSLKNIKIVTLAPELENSQDFIKTCNAIVSLGHTNADYNCAINAIENGAKCLTHIFNAMPPLHHRNPSVIGAAIEKETYIQVICDGIHLHKSIIKMLYKTFGADKMILISDSMRATGLSDGEYMFGGQPINVENKVARTLDGAIAGSTSTLFECVKKSIEFGIPEKDAFKMASQTPCELLGVKKGKIKVGYDSDFIVLDERNNISLVIIDGKILNKE